MQLQTGRASLLSRAWLSGGAAGLLRASVAAVARPNAVSRAAVLAARTPPPQQPRRGSAGAKPGSGGVRRGSSQQQRPLELKAPPGGDAAGLFLRAAATLGVGALRLPFNADTRSKRARQTANEADMRPYLSRCLSQSVSRPGRRTPRCPHRRAT